MKNYCRTCELCVCKRGLSNKKYYCALKKEWISPKSETCKNFVVRGTKLNLPKKRKLEIVEEKKSENP